MARPRREIDEDGRVECFLCGEGIYIWNFSTRRVDEFSPLKEVWFEKDGKLYGKPHGYCKTCMKYRSRGTHVEYKLACMIRRAHRVDDVLEAERQAHRVEIDAEFDRLSEGLSAD